MNVLAEDDDIPLHEFSKITKGEFSRGLFEFFEQSNLFRKDSRLLLNFLHNSLGDVINLPVVLRKQTTNHSKESGLNEEKSISETFFSDNVTSNVERYTCEPARYFSYDQCENDCIIYLGENENSMRCPTCKYPRFRRCTKYRCKTKGKFTCAHLLSTGIPFKQFYYRPIIILIMDLVAQGHFENYLNYRRTHQNTKTLSDFMDGEIARAHLNDMKEKGNRWLERDSVGRKDTVMINLLLCEFYDSGQLFKSKVVDFWPLCIGILNLPPPLRGKVGLSWFIAALYTGKHSIVEKFIFNDLVCEELRCLFGGIEHKVNGKTYFIQARMVMHLLDTKAAEPCMGYQSCANSKFGCPNCGGITGIHNGSKCIFLGHRNYLPQLHVLRFFGQTGYCCPPGFYDHEKMKQWHTKERFHHMDTEDGFYETFFVEGWTVIKSAVEGRKGDSFLEENEEDINNICQPCDKNKDTLSSIKNFLFHNSSQYQWFHRGDFDFEKTFDIFKPFLYYRHQDYRTRKPYRRVTYAEYLSYAKEAEKLNSNNQSTKSNKHHIHGIQRKWYWARLQYGDIESQFTWPFVHAISGVVTKVLQLITHNLFTSNNEKTSTNKNLMTKSTNMTKSKGSGKKRKALRKQNNLPQKNKKGSRRIAEEEEEEEEDTQMTEEEDAQSEDVAQSEDARSEDAPIEDDASSGDVHIDDDTNIAQQFRPLYANGEAPFQVSNKNDVTRVQVWLNCVLLPKGSSEDWYVSIMSPSSMKMVQKLKMITCYWDFVIQSIPINEAYKKLFRMFGQDMLRLLNLSTKKSDVENLLYCVIETIATWEGMMPSNSNTFQLHELVDLPLYIRMVGPPYACSEMTGERMLKHLMDRKKNVVKGGSRSYFKTVMRKQIHHELWTMRRYSSIPQVDIHFSMDHSNGGQLIYNDLPFNIMKPEMKERNSALNTFEVDNLCRTLVAEVSRIYPTVELKQQSALYRIGHSKQTANKSSWSEKIEYVLSHESEFDANVLRVAGNLKNFTPLFYQEATIYGLRFYSRGSNCREQAQPRNDIRAYGRLTYSASKIDSDIWYNKKHYSSWCKWHCHQQGPSPIYGYGLLNAFFSASTLGDECLNGLLLASVTSFKYETSSGKVETVRKEESLRDNLYFVALQDILPTHVATIPFQNSIKTIMTKAVSIPSSALSMRKYLCSVHDDPEVEPEYYVMIMMHPERLALQPSIENRPYSKFMFNKDL